MVTEEEMLAGDHQIEGGDGGGSANNNDNSSNITVPIILCRIFQQLRKLCHHCRH